MTTLIVSPPSTPWVDLLAADLRSRGERVVRLASLAIVGFLLASHKIRAVVVHEDSASTDWNSTRAQMAGIAPSCRFLYVSRNDPRSAPELATAVLRV